MPPKTLKKAQPKSVQRINYFRLVLTAVIAGGLIWYYFDSIKSFVPLGLMTRAPTVNFVFDPSQWPSTATTPASDTTGYFVTAPGIDSSACPLPSPVPVPVQSPAWSIPPNPAKTFSPGTGCAKITKTAWDASGSCWWTCGVGDFRTGGSTNCLRPTDFTDCLNPDYWTLTFDDGPSQYTLQILDILKANNIKATFFMVGAHMVQHPDIVRRVWDEGHEIGIHTWSHHALTTLSTSAIAAEMMWTMKAFYDILGVVPRFFRPPLGDIDDRVRDVASQLGLIPVLWNLDTNDFTMEADSKLFEGLQAAFVAAVDPAKYAGVYTKGIVLLEHDSFAQGPPFFEQVVVPQLKAAGRLPVTTSQCLGLTAKEIYVLRDANTMPRTVDDGFITGKSEPPKKKNDGSAIYPVFYLILTALVFLLL